MRRIDKIVNCDGKIHGMFGISGAAALTALAHISIISVVQFSSLVAVQCGAHRLTKT